MAESVVESWGPEAFARRLRGKIQTTQVALPEEILASNRDDVPRGFNILLIGPTGAGKSSLIYTWWRSLTGAAGEKSSYFTNFAHHSLLRRLNVGWTTAEIEDADGAGGAPGGRSAQLQAAPRHGTSSLTAFELQAAGDKCGHVQIHDTKGQQFFTEREEKFARDMLEGKVLPGSTPDEVHWRYWISIGQFGLFVTTNLASAPHALVLVFDATLRSFHSVLADAKAGEVEDNELAVCYRKVVARAFAEGQPIFAVLTHVDQLQVRDDDEEGNGDEEGEDEEDEEDDELDELEELVVGSRHEVLERFKELLSSALTVGATGFPPQHIYCIENYRRDRFGQDAEVDFRALEALDAAVAGANDYIKRRKPEVEKSFCAVM